MDCKVEFFSKYVFLKFKDQKKKKFKDQGHSVFQIQLLTLRTLS